MPLSKINNVVMHKTLYNLRLILTCLSIIITSADDIPLLLSGFN